MAFNNLGGIGASSLPQHTRFCESLASLNSFSAHDTKKVHIAGRRVQERAKTLALIPEVNIRAVFHLRKGKP